MKKIFAIVLNFVSVILVGISFGLGALPMSEAYGLEDAPIGNFYETVWCVSNGPYSVGSIVLFFFLCIGALIVTITLFMNSKKTTVVNGLSAIVLIAAGVLMFFIPTLYLAGFGLTAQASNYELASGSISMGVVILVAGVFQVIKTLLVAKVDNAQ